MTSNSSRPDAEQSVSIPIGHAILVGDLVIPSNARGIVVFAHGSGSSRHSKRNRYVARIIHEAGLGTLLFDLLTADEEVLDVETAKFRFNIPLLSERVIGAVEWLSQKARPMSLGCFGASTGAAAALVAAARRPELVRAVVSRGGRPDLAHDELAYVKAPTLLIVGGDDGPVIGMNEQALDLIGSSAKKLITIPGATHLFEEPGALEKVARLAAAWFSRYLDQPRPAAAADAHSPNSESPIYDDRRDAGRQLATALSNYADRDDVVVLALPRGGVPVAMEVARALHAPLDAFLVRKLGVPGREELAMGAIASGGLQVVNEDVVRVLGIPAAIMDQVAARERSELDRRERTYRDGNPPADITGKVVIIVDDGLATGTTMRAAVLALRQRSPSRIVVAVPVGARETCTAIGQLADEVVCPQMPEQFSAVGLWYADFSQTSDEEVRSLLAEANAS